MKLFSLCVLNACYFWSKYNSGPKYYTPQVWPDRGSNSRLCRSWQYISCHLDACSNHSAISDPVLYFWIVRHIAVSHFEGIWWCMVHLCVKAGTDEFHHPWSNNPVSEQPHKPPDQCPEPADASGWVQHIHGHRRNTGASRREYSEDWYHCCRLCHHRSWGNANTGSRTPDRG